MSLRQRGQRASESTNEGGSGGLYSPSPSAAGGGGYGYGASPSPNSNNANPYGGGGYYSASPSAAASTSNNYGYSGASAGYGGAYNSNAAVASPYSAGGYASGYSTNDNNSATYGNSVTAGAGYGGYNDNNNNNSGGGSTASPFQTTKKSASFNLATLTNNILPLLLGLSICTLTATTLHFRRSMINTRLQIEQSRQTIETNHRRSQQKFATGRENLDREKVNLIASNEQIRSQINSLKTATDELSTRHSSLIDQLNGEEISKQSTLKKIDSMKFKLEDLAVDMEKYSSMLEGKAEVEKFSKKREKALWEVVERLESKIGRESWREAEEW